MRLNLDRDQVNALKARVGGWVAGLQLAGLSIQKLGQPEQVMPFIDDFKGSHLRISDYLTDEVLSHQTSGVQKFLLQTSL